MTLPTPSIANTSDVPHMPRYLWLTGYGIRFWVPILVGGLVGIGAFIGLAIYQPQHALLWRVLIGIMAVLTVAGLAFFRDPDRKVPQDPDIMVSPADGTVTEITPFIEMQPISGSVVRLGIFLSVLDVHLNRAPCAGVVVQSTFRPGKFLDARNPLSSSQNQSNTVVLAESETGHPAIIVKQITGAIARRIITPLIPGHKLERGQRFGMIAFGSRTELYVPADRWQFTVQVGQKLKAGKTIVARKIS